MNDLYYLRTCMRNWCCLLKCAQEMFVCLNDLRWDVLLNVLKEVDAWWKLDVVLRLWKSRLPGSSNYPRYRTTMWMKVPNSGHQRLKMIMPRLRAAMNEMIDFDYHAFMKTWFIKMICLLDLMNELPMLLVSLYTLS